MIHHLESKSLKTRTLPKILLFSTGGTIASRIDYRTGEFASILNASDLYAFFPEISNYHLFILNFY